MARKKNVISFDMQFSSNAESLFDKITQASSKTGKSLEKDLSDALNHAQANLKNYADMQKQVLAGATDITKPLYEATRKAAKASAEFLYMYNNAQVKGNEISEQLTQPYKDLEKELEEVNNLIAKQSRQRANAKENLENLTAIEKYEKVLADILNEEEEYQKQIEFTNKKIRGRERTLIDRGKAEEIPYDSHIKGFETTINKLKGKIEELHQQYTSVMEDCTQASVRLQSRGIQPSTDAIQHELLAIYALDDELKANKLAIADIEADMQSLVDAQGKFEYVGVSPEATNHLKDLATDMTVLQRTAEEAAEPVKKIGDQSRKIGINLKWATSLMHGFANAIKHASIHHSKLHSSSKGLFEDTRKGFKHALRNIMRYGLGVRSLYFLFRRLRNATKEAFKIMAQEIPEVNQQVSSLVTNFNLMKANLATMVQPLLKWVVPAFDRLAHAAQTAMEWVGKLFATITGQGYIYRASSAWVDYADSVNGAAKAVNNLLGIDELNVLNDSKGSGSGTFNPENIGYELVEVNEGIFEKLREAWENADFTEIGQIFYTKLGNIFKSINAKMPEMENFCKRVATSFATFINGYVRDYGDAPRLAETIAGLINVAVNTLGTFTTAVHWDEVGRFIHDGINGFLRTFSFSGMAWSIANLLNAITTTVYNAVSDWRNWALLGYKLGQGINTFARTYHWADLGKTAGSLIIGILSFVTGAIEKIDVLTLGQAVADLFNGVPWEELVWHFGNLMEVLRDKIVELIAGIDFTGLLTGKMANVKEIEAGNAKRDYGEDSQEYKTAKATADAWKKEEERKKGFWTNIGNWIATTWNNTLDAMWQMENPMLPESASMYEQSGTDAANGYLSGFNSADIPGETGKVMDNAVDAARKALDEHSPSRVFRQIGQFVVDGFMLPFRGDAFYKSFAQVWQKLPLAIKSPLNQLISSLNQFLQALQTVQNASADMFASLGSGLASVNGPSVNITRWTAPKIPYLAQGAVIPPNSQFLAVLGDQKQGTNIEAPLSTIQEAVATVLEPYLRQIADNTQILTEKDYGTYISDREIAMASARGSSQLGLPLIR